MPIRYHIESSPIGVSQSFDSPTVYLDHWALRDLCDDSALQDRFVAGLSRAGGTLLMSHMNFAEFAAVEDAGTCDRGEAFLSRVFPNIYFSEFNIDKAIQQEEAQSLLVIKQRLAPPSDPQMLRAFAHRYPVTSPAMQGFIAEVHQHRVFMKAKMDGVNSRIAARLLAQRSDPSFVKAARSTPIDNGRVATKLVFGELMRDFVLDNTSSVEPNDAMDMQHATVSLAYCDFVLLDGKFADKVRRMKDRMAGANMAMPIAACYSKRDNGVDQFLSSLESWS